MKEKFPKLNDIEGKKEEEKSAEELNKSRKKWLERFLEHSGPDGGSGKGGDFDINEAKEKYRKRKNK